MNTSSISNSKKKRLYLLLEKLKKIRDYAKIVEKQYASSIKDIHPNYKNSAVNLIHYLAIRTFDLDEIQEQLSMLGLSSLDHSEGYTLSNLENIIQILYLINGDIPPKGVKGFKLDYPKSKSCMNEHAEDIFGPRPSGSRTRIMVTMPSDAASNKKLIDNLLDAGMNCARINCSHDSREEWAKMVKNIKKISKKKGITCLIYMDLAGPKLRTGSIKEKRKKKKQKKKKKGIKLHVGDTLNVFNDDRTGRDKVVSKKGKLKEAAFISTTLPAIFRDIKEGESIWFDDGKIGGEIKQLHDDHFEVAITQASKKGDRLMASKGINLPDTELTLSSLTEEDFKTLPFILDNADMIGYSFVRKPEDVHLLQQLLDEFGREDIGIILKIETWDAFHNLPQILLAAMKSPRIGIMIARGDLAIEVGWKRLSELQEEILWLCEAAHIPTIWATQILENLAKKGLATRSEITDAAMAARAECAMLNKGPYITKAVATLGDITARMKAHQRKKMGTLRSLGVARDFVNKTSNGVMKNNKRIIETNPMI